MGESITILYSSSDRCPSINNDLSIVRLSSNILKKLKQVFSIVNNEKPVIVEFYLHDFSRKGALFELIILMLCRFKNINTTVICTGREILNFSEHSFLKRASIKLHLHNSKYFLIKELYMRKQISELNIADTRKCLFVHNGVDDALSKVNIKSDKKIVLFFNSFKKWRNVPFLVDCAISLTKIREDVIFLIVGARNESEINQATDLLSACDQNIKDRIQVMKMSNNKSLFLGLADLFVLPADIVWLNNSILEAMSSEVCVLLPNLPGSNLIIEDQVSGFIHEHLNKEDFINKVNYIFSMDESSISEVKSNAKLRVRKIFGVKKRAILHKRFHEVIISDTENLEFGLYTDTFDHLKSEEEVLSRLGSIKC